MIIIFSSKLFDFVAEPHLSLIRQYLELQGKDCVCVNPLALHRDNFSVGYQHGERIFMFNGQRFNPTSIYMLNKWRIDAMIDFAPNDPQYPGLVRSRVEQLLKDFYYLFKECSWLPGSIELIERYDSKPRLFFEASELGLKTPRMTVDSMFSPNSGDDIYRKCLSYPFVVTYDLVSKEEAILEITNEKSDPEEFRENIYWQWQNIINHDYQVRCFVLGNQIWSSAWQKKENDDLRYIQDVEGKKVIWDKFDLPSEISQTIIDFVKKIGLRSSAPEFLFNSRSNTYTFIDLNPCGDWYGFFSEEVHHEIAEELSRLLV